MTATLTTLLLHSYNTIRQDFTILVMVISVFGASVTKVPHVNISSQQQNWTQISSTPPFFFSPLLLCVYAHARAEIATRPQTPQATWLERKMSVCGHIACCFVSLTFFLTTHFLNLFELIEAYCSYFYLLYISNIQRRFCLYHLLLKILLLQCYDYMNNNSYFLFFSHFLRCKTGEICLFCVFSLTPKMRKAQHNPALHVRA